MVHPLAKALLVTPTAPAAWAQSTPTLDNGAGGWAVQTLAEGLSYSWGIATDGNRLIVTEKAAQIAIVTDAGVKQFPIETALPLGTDVSARQMGIAPAPVLPRQAGGRFTMPKTATAR